VEAATLWQSTGEQPVTPVTPTPRLLAQISSRDREAAEHTRRFGNGRQDKVYPLAPIGDREVGGSGANDRRAFAIKGRAVTLWEPRVGRHSASVQASTVLVFLARLVTLLPVFFTPRKLYRASKRAGKAAEEAFAGGTNWRRQRNELKGLDGGPGCPGKPARPAADVKGGLPPFYTCGRVKAGVAGDTGTKVQKELLLGRGEAQHNIYPDKDEFHAAAATRQRTRLAVRWSFAHNLGNIQAQSTLARGGAIMSWRTSVAKVVFVGTGAYRARVKGFCSRFYAANGNGQQQHERNAHDERPFVHTILPCGVDEYRPGRCLSHGGTAVANEKEHPRLRVSADRRRRDVSGTAGSAAATRSPARWGTHRGQHPCHERQQLLQRVEMGGLPGHHMFRPPRYLTLRDVGAQAEVYDKGPVNG